VTVNEDVRSSWNGLEEFVVPVKPHRMRKPLSGDFAELSRGSAEDTLHSDFVNRFEIAPQQLQVLFRGDSVYYDERPVRCSSYAVILIVQSGFPQGSKNLRCAAVLPKTRQGASRSISCVLVGVLREDLQEPASRWFVLQLEPKGNDRVIAHDRIFMVQEFNECGYALDMMPVAKFRSQSSDFIERSLTLPPCFQREVHFIVKLAHSSSYGFFVIA
jgi:hypothetical protein